jgi:hypothetical protein
MGLAISRSIVEPHDGRLWATANDGRAATFHFTLPNQVSETLPSVQMKDFGTNERFETTDYRHAHNGNTEILGERVFGQNRSRLGRKY